MASSEISRRSGVGWGRRAVLAMAVAVAAVPLFASVPAGAAVAVPVSNINLTWKLSDNTFTTSGSLTEAKAADSPAVLDASNGWIFTSGSGTYDPYTGETHIAFAGALSVGNTSFGNFGEKLASPSIDIDADGHGTLTAAVSVRGPAPGPPDPALWQSVATVVVARFDAPDDQVTVVDGHVSWTFTPFFPAVIDGRRQFESSFVDILPAAFQGSFRESVGQAGNQPQKAPSPVSVSFDFDAPTTSASQTTGLDPAGQTITVDGSGFKPDIDLFVVNCDANFPAGARCDFGRFVQAHTDGSGNFSTQVTVVASFGNAPNNTDCLSGTTNCAIQTSRVGQGSDRTQETTLPISFATPEPPPPPPAPPVTPETPASADPIATTPIAFTGDATLPIAIAGVACIGAGLLCLRASRRRGMMQVG